MPRPRDTGRPTPAALYREAREADELAAYAELRLGDRASARVMRNSAAALRRRAREEAKRRRLEALTDRFVAAGLLKRHDPKDR